MPNSYAPMSGVRSFATSFRRVEASTVGENFNISFDYYDKETSLQCGKDSTLKGLKKSIQKELKDQVESVDFYTLDQSELALSEKLCNLRDNPILLTLNGKSSYAINFNENYNLKESLIFEHDYVPSEENVINYCNSIGIPSASS